MASKSPAVPVELSNRNFAVAPSLGFLFREVAPNIAGVVVVVGVPPNREVTVVLEDGGPPNRGVVVMVWEGGAPKREVAVTIGGGGQLKSTVEDV